MRSHSRLFLALLTLCTFSSAAASEPEAPTDEAHAAETPRPKRSPSERVSGFYFGHISYLNRETGELAVTAEDTQQEKNFAFDKKTKVQVGKKRARTKDLYFGDKVAVRYFGDHEVRVADTVFVVFGPFKPQDYIAKRKAPPKAEGHGKEEKKEEGGHEKKEEAGHGAAPPPKKSGGGGHH